MDLTNSRTIGLLERAILLLGLAVLCTQQSSAWTSRSYTVENGLSNTRITHMFQDSRMNVWVSTYNGLNRFDGLNFNIYRHDYTNGRSLLNNKCQFVFESGEACLFVATEVGIQRYDYDRDLFETIPMISLGGDTVTTKPVCMVEMPDGTVVVTTSGYGVFHLESDGFKESARYQLPGETEHILADSRGRIWLSDRGGNVYLRNSRIGHFNAVIGIVESAVGYVYVASANEGLFRYDESKADFVRVLGGGYSLNRVRLCDYGRLFLCTDGDGLLYFDERDLTVAQSGILSFKYRFQDSNVSDAFYDHFGNLWAGVFWKGVEVRPPKEFAINQSESRWSFVNNLGTNCVTAIEPARESEDGDIWVATVQSGLYRISKDGTKKDHFEYSDISGMPVTIMSVHSDAQGRLWLGSLAGGAYFLDKSCSRVTKLSQLVGTEADGMPAVNDIKHDSYSRIWYATNGSGLYCLDNSSATPVLKHYSGKAGNETLYPYCILENLNVNCIHIGANLLLAGTSNGLELFDLDAEGLSKRGRILDMTEIHDILPYESGTYLVATNSGLYHIGISGSAPSVLAHYTIENGLGDNGVSSVGTDAGAVVWVGTDNGLSRLEITTSKIVTYTTADGLAENEYSANACLFKDGKMYFGTTGGIVFFDSNDISTEMQETSLPGRVSIIGLLLNGNRVKAGDVSGSRTITDKWIPETDCVRLSHSDRSFCIELSVMNACLNHLHYMYRIDSGAWNHLPKSQKSININNLRAGKHVVEVSSKECNGSSSLTIMVYRPWYVSIVAILCYIAAIVFAVATNIRARRQTSSAVREKEHLKHEVELVRNMKRVDELNVNSPDDLFMQRVMKIVNRNLSNPDMNVEFLADQVGISRAHFYRRLKSITDMSPVDFLKNVRLQEAARLLVDRNCDVSDASRATGFKSVSAFSTAFKKFYGMTPSNYIKNKGLVERMPD